MVCLWRGVSLPSFVPPCGFGSFERIFIAFEMTLARVWKVLFIWFNFVVTDAPALVMRSC